jgi:hypothetical protein
MACPTCRSKINLFQVYGNIKGDCVICFNSDVDIIMFKCGHYVCKYCMEAIQQHEEHNNNLDDEINFSTESHIEYIDDIDDEMIHYYTLITDLEHRIPKLGMIIEHAMLSIEEMIRLKEWIDVNQAIYCYELLENFDEVIQAIQLTEQDISTIQFLRDELARITDENI